MTYFLGAAEVLAPKIDAALQHSKGHCPGLVGDATT